MADRALIIAIQNYDKATSGFTANKLEGTLDAAKAFRAWLEEKWQREGVDHSLLFCSEPQLPGERGAASQDIIDALVELQKGRDATENLYVYFSGHGFRAQGETIKLADVLVCADFIDTQRSAAACFKLDALVAGLRESLGTGFHFYFIDACRNEVSKAVLSNIMPFDGRGSEEPSVFVLQSTVANAPALVGGPFAQLLVKGLRGAGKAKVWVPPITKSMKVRFDSLRGFLTDGLKKVQPITQSTSGEKGENDAILATITPIDPSVLTLTIAGYQTGMSGTASIAVFGGAPAAYDIIGPTLKLELPPNFYMLTVTIDSAALAPAGPIDLDLFESRNVTVTVQTPMCDGQGAPPIPEPHSGHVRLSIPADTRLLMQHVDTGRESLLTALSQELTLPQGAYRAELQTRAGQTIVVKEITVAPGSTVDLAPASWQGDAARESIARRFPHRHGGIDFSESLGGAVTDPDLSIWLSIIGGGRIIGTGGDFSKIAPLPLADFSAEPPGASPIYMLAGLVDPNIPLVVGVSSAMAPPQWIDMGRPPDLDGVHEAVTRQPPGQWFVTFCIGAQPAYTVTSAASPNRATLIVLTLDSDGQPRVSQYLLPIGHLTANLNPEVRQRLEYRNQLHDVQVLARLSRAFRKRRRIQDEFKAHELQELLYAKWLDPIGASLAAYESLRRNRGSGLLVDVANNMARYFGDLPDTAAIQRLSGVNQRARPLGVPLFLDGLRAFADDEIALPFPKPLLDYTGVWTAWRGAVGTNP
jgi:hypothetical protein